jgi:hypothetical protein
VLPNAGRTEALEGMRTEVIALRLPVADQQGRVGGLMARGLSARGPLFHAPAAGWLGGARCGTRRRRRGRSRRLAWAHRAARRGTRPCASPPGTCRRVKRSRELEGGCPAMVAHRTYGKFHRRAVDKVDHTRGALQPLKKWPPTVTPV